jgi:hypothetical protein
VATDQEIKDAGTVLKHCLNLLGAGFVLAAA